MVQHRFNNPWSNPEITPKVPPGWDPAHNAQYSFDRWTKDMVQWNIATEIPVHQRASTVVLRLGGLAKEIALELDTDHLQNGTHIDFGDGQPPQHVNGLEYLVHTMAVRFAALGIETSLRAMFEYQRFHRGANESIDEALSRFTLLRVRARNLARYNMGIARDWGLPGTLIFF